MAQAIITQGMAFTIRPTISYRALEIGIAPAWLGAIAATYAAAPLLCALFVGQATDRIGPKKIMVAGTTLMAVSGLIFITLAGSAATLILGSAVLGIGHLMAVLGQQAAVSRIAGPGKLAAAFGHYTLAGSLGQALGPGIIAAFGTGAAIPRTEAVFVVTGAAMAFSVCLAISVREVKTSPRANAAKPATWQDLFHLRGIIPAITISTIVLAAIDITLIYLPVLGAELGLTAAMVSILLSVRATSSMLSRFFLGRMARAWGSNRLLLTSLLISAIAMAVVPIGMPIPVLIALLVVLGFALGIGQPVTMAWLAAAVPSGSQGRAMSLRLSGGRLGQIIFPTAAGAIAAGLGAAGALWAAAFGLIAAGVISGRHPLHPS
ncbi:hypothetical protein GCM10027562_25100 [Arthrobacter pigmenti]